MMDTLTALTYEQVPFFSFAGLDTVGKVAHVIDGDTSHIIMLDKQGLPMKHNCRLYGIDTPEMTKTPVKAIRARNRFLQLATNCTISLDDIHNKHDVNAMIDSDNTKLLFIKCQGNDKYGRQLVTLYLDESKTQCVNDILVQEGFAHQYEGGKKQEWVV